MVQSSFEFHGVVAGVDVSDKSSRICVMSAPGEILLEDVVKNNEDAFRAKFTKFAPLRVVLEAGTHTHWIRDVLTSLGHELLIVDPRDPRTQGTKKTDREDARRLAMAGFLPAGYLNTVRYRSRATHLDLTQLRARGALVGARTTLVNSVRGLVKPLGGRIQRCDPKVFPQRAVKDLPRELLRIVLPLLRSIRELSRAIAACDRRLSRITAKRYPIAQTLAEQIPGVGPVTSLAFVLTVEDPRRFKRSRDVGAYIGLAPATCACARSWSSVRTASCTRGAPTGT
ncbi:MAG: transposase [Planctomycetes bacterium]|nr:transposase [Planctomycetota bacterium]